MEKKQGKLEEAISILERALAIAEKTEVLEPHVAITLTQMAGIYYPLKGDLDRAEHLYLRAISIGDKLSLQKWAYFPSANRGLAEVLWGKGDYDQAERLYQRGIALAEEHSGVESPQIVVHLNGLALLYKSKSDYGKAEQLLRRALKINEKHFGQNNHNVALSLFNLGQLYQVKGDYDVAEAHLKRAVEIAENDKTLTGYEANAVSMILIPLAFVHIQNEEYEKAEPLLRRALSLTEKAWGTEHFSVALVLEYLGGLYLRKEEYAAAEKAYRRELGIFEKTFGPSNKLTATAIAALGATYLQMGEVERAEQLLRRALAIHEEIGTDEQSIASSLGNVAIAYLVKENLAQALPLLSRANEIRENSLSLNLYFGSDDQKQLFAETFKYETSITVSTHLRLAPSDSEAAKLALTTILRRKGRVLDALAENLAILQRYATPADRALLEQLDLARSRFSSFALNGRATLPPDQHKDRLVKLKAEVQLLEDAVSTRSSEFRVGHLPISLKLVQESIPEGAALVEMGLFQPFNFKSRRYADNLGSPRYLAYVLRRSGSPMGVDLGEASEIDREIANMREALRNPDRRDVRKIARILDEQVMRPVRQLLGKTNRVFVSPDGALNLIPFAALVDEQDHYLVENYSISYLTSGRDLLRIQAAPKNLSDKPVVIANPNFGDKTTAASNQNSSQGAFDFASARFDPLPGTMIEAEVIGAMLSEAQVLTGPEATEAAVKQVNRPRILHVATHGFFLPDRVNEGMTNSKRRGPNLVLESRSLILEGVSTPPTTAQFRRKGEHPLLRSGLAFAGANKREGGQGEDGILTALEAAGLNLWGTKLVVLSACETGLGEVRNGEGVYGLRRALVLAGSESQVISLWPVSDTATRDLMVDYYKRLEAGQESSEALRQVQLEMLKTRNRNHPFYWASFIQSGDWRSIH